MSVYTTPAGEVTVSGLQAMKRDGRPIAAMTAYDATHARVLDAAGMDIVLVGDSLGMVVQGQSTTLPVTVDDMIYHARAVRRGLQRALLMVDMPFMSFASPEEALHNAGRMMKEAGAQMVKLEGGSAQVATVHRLNESGIPVCAHLGLKPQSVHKIGGYRVQGRDEASARAMVEDALALEAAGADIVLLECVPAELAREIAQSLTVPVIGIGSGAHCDGQILVLYDAIGLTPKPPRFSRDFLADTGSIPAAIADYVESVREHRFPGTEQTVA
ncbi:MAG: 3-methyl-2-oxobutanoate hydroxymethyltransferase [Halofilum sp. (in: g-proteobacteria)]|nr:3-methyl-2-oxobutanoate hydroxymethyltransferase [Halofilum sp. (in: g-proteobacteria)]